MNEFWIATGVSVLTGVAGYLTGRKREKIDIQGGEFENYQKFVAVNREIISDMRTQILDLIEENRLMRSKVDELELKVRQLNNTFPCKACPEHQL